MLDDSNSSATGKPVSKLTYTNGSTQAPVPAEPLINKGSLDESSDSSSSYKLPADNLKSIGDEVVDNKRFLGAILLLLFSFVVLIACSIFYWTPIPLVSFAFCQILIVILLAISGKWH